MRRIAVLNIAGLLLFGLWSCTTDQLPVPGVDQSGICFETEILPIFVSNCSAPDCHNPIDREEGYDLTSYEGIRKGVKVFDPKRSKLLKYIRERGEDQMPPPPQPPLTDDQVSLIEAWINIGAPNTTDCEGASATCDQLADVSYAAEVRPILDRYCVGCHRGSGGNGGVDMTGYSGVQRSVNSGSLLGSIQHTGGFSPMPQNGNRLSNCQIKTIATWIGEGALDN